MLDKQRMFDECILRHLGSYEAQGVATGTVLCAAFACMRERLTAANATPDDVAAFVAVIERAINNHPSLALPQYAQDKADLQRMLQWTFNEMPCDVNRPLKLNFLNGLRF